MYDEKINQLIDFALVDGKLTDSERTVLIKKAEALGIDIDEFGLVLEAKLHQKKDEQRNVNDNKTIEKSFGPSLKAIIIFGLAILYGISPVDLVPDIPVIGWIDDGLITIAASLNLLQSSLEKSNIYLAKIIKALKIITILLGAIIILLFALIGGLIIKLFS